MRITYRTQDNKEYWFTRWNDTPADGPMKNTSVYPLMYANQAISSDNGKILEAGCGLVGCSDTSTIEVSYCWH